MIHNLAAATACLEPLELEPTQLEPPELLTALRSHHRGLGAPMACLGAFLGHVPLRHTSDACPYTRQSSWPS